LSSFAAVLCASAAVAAPPDSISSAGVLELSAKTRPTPSGRAELVSIVLHPIIAVHVAPGDRVKRGQVLIEMDRDEPEADVRESEANVKEHEASLARIKAVPIDEERAKAKADLEAARATAKGAKEQLERLTPLLEQGAAPTGQVLQARTTAMHSEATERSAAAYLDYLLKQPIPQEIAEAESRLVEARAQLDASKAELEHYTLFAPIDGIVASLDAPLGRSSRPGTAVWGEVVDLHEIDAQADVSPEQAAQLSVGAPAELRWPTGNADPLAGRIVFISPVADVRGVVAVVARFANPKELLRAGITVSLRLSTSTAP
jgi:multidrug resistance efflux pump